MARLTGSLEIAKNTLLNTQAYIQTASHNIANADNSAYARQKVVQVTSYPLLTRAGWLGSGASLEKIVQQRDAYVDERLLQSRSKQSMYDAEATQLRIAAGYLSDDGESGISGALGNFWDAWDALNQNPGGEAEKTVVTERARSLAEAIRGAYSQLEGQADTIEEEVEARITDAQSLLEDIAEYNKEISLAEGRTKQSANDLRDRRHQALMDLAELVPIEYEEAGNGSITVKLLGTPADVELVNGNTAATLAYDGTNHVMTVDAQQVNSLEGGTIQGLLTSLTEIGIPPGSIPADPNDSSLSYIDRLNGFANALITQVNSLHSTSPVFTGTTAADIAVDGSFEPDGDLALQMAELQNQSGTVGTGTFDDYLGDIQNQIGLDVEKAEGQMDFYSSLSEQLLSEQQSISGVSIDEEMVELLKQQQIYQAAAKIVQYTSEMLDTVINMA
jgi:flagellar hook-associated protein FlgK